MSAVGGSIMALWSAKGIFVSRCLVLSRSKAAQPPVGFCMDQIQLRPRREAFSRLDESGSSKCTWRSASMTMAVSSMSAYQELENWKCQPAVGPEGLV